jgi:hypothetical protein
VHVDTIEEPVDLDPVQERVHVRPSEQGIDVHADDDGVDVDAFEDPVDVDATEHTVHVHTIEHTVHVHTIEDAVDLHAIEQGAGVDPRDQTVHVDPSDQPIDVDPGHHRVDVEPREHGVGIELLQHAVAQRPREVAEAAANPALTVAVGRSHDGRLGWLGIARHHVRPPVGSRPIFPYRAAHRSSVAPPWREVLTRSGWGTPSSPIPLDGGPRTPTVREPYRRIGNHPWISPSSPVSGPSRT